MVSEKSIKDKSLDFINPDVLSYLFTVLPRTPYDNSLDFCLPPDRVEQYLDLRNPAMYEGDDTMSQEFNVPSSEALKAALAELDSGSPAAPQRSEVFSRQTSLTEEWFGNVSNAHPNDITVDSSLEALFASTDWPDLDAEMPTSTDAAVTDNCFADPSVYPSVNFHDADAVHNEETVASKSLPELSTVCTTELQLVVPEEVGNCLSQKTEARAENWTRTRRKRRISSESRESFCSDIESESIEDLKRFAQKFLSDGSRAKPYFWQYNAQSRGPKARRLCSSVTVQDSHTVPDFADPVFCNGLPYQLSHSGKARQGDGNDPRPAPQELLAIGSRIWRLETEFKSVSAEPLDDASSRGLANQRKNQLASKVCRLKKKALHAANKIKLDGLKQEHDQLMKVITSIADEIDHCIATKQIGSYSLCQALDRLIRNHLTFMIAGNTAQYVNSELEKVAKKLVSENE